MVSMGFSWKNSAALGSRRGYRFAATRARAIHGDGELSAPLSPVLLPASTIHEGRATGGELLQRANTYVTFADNQ